MVMPPPEKPKPRNYGGYPPIWFKACPVCNGDVTTVRELEGDEQKCIQCGREVK